MNRLSAEERHRLLVAWNDTRTDYPKERCVHELFEAQVARTPDAVAVVFEDQALTYRELNRRANRLAHHLHGLGVGPEVPVGICVERSLEMLIGLLAILKAGGAYVPLDPALPQARLAHMVQDTALPVLLTHRRAADRLGKQAAQVVWFEELPSSPESENLAGSSTPTALAYIIYTSGSTGQPKGVEISHQALVNCLHHFQRSLKVGPHDVWLAVTALSFDIAGLELWLPLLAGARVIIATSETARDARRLNQALIDHGATLLQATPATWQGLVQSGWQGNAELQILCGGEALPQQLADRLAVLGARAWNVYGPTETTIWSTTSLLVASRPVNIGGPLANTQIYVLDAQHQPLPVGVPGELFIGGDGLARGYRNAPELTAQRFIANPFSRQPGARLYKTGDRARRLPDGSLEFIGRLDHQVKIRGHRVELGEIETVLGGHPDLIACAVVARNPGDADKTLAAFVVGRAPARPSVAALRRWLGEKLPDHMIPSRFFMLPALPVNANGKVDRKALEKTGAVELELGTGYAAPRNPRERELVEIWQAVLGRERIGIHDNFFHLGGHSLLAVAIGWQITLRLDLEVPLRWIFEHPTCAGLARQVECLKGQDADARPIAKADRTKPLPLSFAQQGMWLLHQTLPAPAAYNVPVCWRLHGSVAVDRMREGLQTIVCRHEVLRTALVLQAEALVQQVLAAEDVPLPWQEVDLQALPATQQTSAWEQRLLEEARRPFDLAQAPLWRAVWIQLAEDEHVLGITFHHSLVDEWSLRLFLGELERFYAAAGDLAEAGRPALPVQYADYAVWQRQRLTGQLLEAQRDYWRAQLKDLPPALELPTDNVRPARRSGGGAVYDFQLSGPVVTRLRELARQEDTTLFTVMLAAFQVWLHRYTGQTDVVVGTPVANRQRPETQALLGCFLNTLPIRMRLEGNPAFRQVSRQARDLLLGAFSHADLPFEQMVELAVMDREPAQQPVFQVMFVLLEEGLGTLALDRVGAQGLPVATGTSKNDLTLSIQAAGETWDCQFEYASDLFTADTAARFGRHLAELLRSITADPERPIGQLNLLPETERRQVLEEWNRTQREYPQDKCIHELFEAQVARSPEAVAVVFEDQSLTYRQLNGRANQLAHHLRALGVGPEVRVGICVERSLEMVVGVLGVLKAGGAYVPLDPALPPELLAHLIQDAALPVLLAPRRGAERFEKHAARVVWLAELPAGLREENLTVCVSAANLAYVLYTSGSTGQPKGVAMEHRPLVNLMWWEVNRFPAGLRTLQFAALSFDVSFQEMFSTWLSSGTLVLVDAQTRRHPAALWEFIAARELERLFLPVVMLQQLAEAAASAPQRAPALREISTAGEPLRITPAIRGFFAARPGLRLHNQYGPTESHVVTTWTLPAAPETWPEFPPLGKPIANTTVHLLDEHMNPVPLGVPGEIHIGGEAPARGYLNQPKNTAERFLPDPFGRQPAARLYKTGDLARRLPDGNLEFLGRLDDQVKIRGFRVELGEVQAVLSGHADISACAVVTQNPGGGNKRLAAFVVGRKEAGLTVAELRRWLGEKLPGHMIPSRFFVLPALPVNANGKVDRKALEKAGAVELDLGTGYAAPRNPRECELVEIWQAVLGRERIGIHDNFFHLGGHSLLAVKAVSRMRQALGVDLSLRTLFECPTIAVLAVKSPRRQDSTAPATPPLVPAERHGLLPLSFAQQRLWFLDRFEGSSTAYHLRKAMRLRGALRRDALERAVNEIVARHESLRTHFVQVDGEPAQVVAPQVRIVLPMEDLSALGEQARQAALATALEQQCKAPFDLSQGPLLRATLYKLGELEHILLLACHHIVADGWSLTVFHRELAALYAAFCQGLANPLEPLAVQYPDFTLWQRRWLQGPELERQVSYWTHKLQGAPPLLALPTDKPRTARRSPCGASRTLDLPGDLAGSLAALCQREGATLFMGLLASFKVLLARYSGQEDVVIGTPIASRNQVGLEGLIGFFVSTVAIRTDLSGHPTFAALLQRVRTTVLEALEHQDLPFEKLIEELHLPREPRHTPVFQIFFNLLNLEAASDALFELEVEGVPLPEPEAKFDLTLYALERGEQIRLQAVYNSELFQDATIERMLAQWHLLLEQIVRSPAAGIYSHALVRPQDWAVLPEPTCPLARQAEPAIHEGFVLQAKRVPQRTAVVDSEGQWTYAELERVSGRLANYLRREGVGPGEVVAVYASRSAALVGCLLGILRAGGVFLILDSAYPARRLCRCLGQAKPAGLLVLGSAGGVPAAIQEWVGRNALRCHLEIPATKAQVMDGFLSDCDAGDPEVGVSGDDPAYVAFTSGSTGQPLGIQANHAPTSHFLRWHIGQFGLREEDRFSLLSGLAHDPVLRDVFTPLWLGASLHIPPAAVYEEPGCLARWVSQQGITVCHSTPALAELLGEPAAGQRQALAALRWLFLGGDRLTQGTVQKLRRWNAACGLVNFYGTTETPQAMSFAVIEACGEAPRPAGQEVPLGRGIDGAQLLLLNPADQVAGIGEWAEICIRTPHLSTGYLGEAQRTRERFQTNPFTGRTEDRIYRTGDMGRYLADGRVALAGRKDAQLQLRGFRVELGEIEAALRSLPGVRAAGVVAMADTPGDPRLVACLVASGEARYDAATLRARLVDQLPGNLLPNAVVWLDQVPLTPNGKVDRNALSGLVSNRHSPIATALPPANRLELALEGIWQRLFHRQTVGRQDNFFELGGHSLQAVRLVAEIERILGCKLPVAALFQSPTIESLARRLSDEQWVPPWSSLVPLQPLGTKPPLFLVHGWGGDVYVFLGLAQLLAPDQPVYGIQALGMDGKAARHTTVESMAEHYVQEIRSFQPAGPYFLGGYSLGGLIALEVAQQLQRRGHEVALLALFDSTPKGVLPWPVYGRIMASYLCSRGLFHLRRWWKMPNRERLDYRRGRWAALQFWLARNRSQPSALTVPPVKDSPPPRGTGLTDYYQAVGAAYQLRPYPGTADVFVSEESKLHWMAGWRHFVRGGVRVHRVPGKHSQILSPDYVTMLAKALTTALHSARPILPG